MAAATQSLSAVSAAVPQSSVVSAAQGLLFGPLAPPCRWPFIEDLVNDPLATSYSDWLFANNFCNYGCLGPSVHGIACVMAQRAGTADQSTSVNKKTALPPVIPFNCSADDHFRQSLFVQRHGTPLDWSAPVEPDVAYAASCMAHPLSEVRARRESGISWMREPSRRLQPVTVVARRLQHPDVASVNPHVHLALFAVIDTRFVSELVHGFPAIGHCPPCGLWQPKPAPFCTLQEALATGVADAADILPRLREHEDSAVALAAGEEDEQRLREHEGSAVALAAGEEDEQLGFCHPSVGWRSCVGRDRSSASSGASLLPNLLVRSAA